MTQRVRRCFFFFLMMGVGIGAGLLLGWEVCPRGPRDAQPETLSIAYKTDMVLMIAELYHHDGDANLAQSRLTFLGDQDLITLLNNALSYAEAHQYTQSDIQMMQALAEGVVIIQPEGL